MAEHEDRVLVLLDALAGAPLRPELRRVGVDATLLEEASERRHEAPVQVQHRAEQVEREGADAIEVRHERAG